jgi:hypothetical protein
MDKEGVVNEGNAEIEKTAAKCYLAAVYIFQWSQSGSNRRPLACHASALPAELWPQREADNNKNNAGNQAYFKKKIYASKNAYAGYFSGLRKNFRKKRIKTQVFALTLCFDCVNIGLYMKRSNKL